MLNRFFIILILISGALLYSKAKQPLIDSLLSIANNKEYISSDIEKFNIYFEIAEKSTYSDTIIYYSKLAIKLAKKLDKSIAGVTLLLGDGFFQAGNHALAFEKYIEAAKLYQKENDKNGLASTYCFISNAYSSQQNYTNSIKFLKMAIDIFENECDSFRFSLAIHNLGFEYYKNKQYDSALVLFDKSKKIFQKIDYEKEYAYCLGNSGLVYSKQNKFSEAKELLFKAINILKKYKDDYAIGHFLLEYANIMKKEENINQAIYYANECYKKANKNNIAELKRDASSCLSELYNLKGKYDSAYYYQSEYVVFNDSLKNLESIQRMADLRTEFEVSQKQIEVDILQKSKTIQLIIIGGLVLIIVLAAGLIYTYYSSLKRAKKFTVVLDERRKLLENQSAELQKLNRIKDKFFSIISHDLRGHISSISSISLLIKEGIENNSKMFLQEMADYIDHTVVSLTCLLENLLNWAQSQQGQFPFFEENINIKKLIHEVVKIFSTIALSKNIRIKLHLQNDLFIKGDLNSLMVIFRNLLSNALKYTVNGGSVSIKSYLNQAGMAEIEVSDTGIGIPPEKIPSLFELKEDKSTWGTEREKGFGLGLNLVNEFVKLNKGKIHVESIVGEGTTFILNFKAIKNKVKERKVLEEKVSN